MAAGYNACATRYNAARAGDPSPGLAQLLQVLPPGGDVLDIGCGGGFPVTAALARRARVTGVDLSPVQIEAARRRVPEAHLIAGDIMAQTFAPASFDAVVSFYALFHLPRAEHAPLLARVGRWLRPGGHLLATVGNSSHPGYTEPDFFGVVMYWSHFASRWYADTVTELGFDVLAYGELDHGYRDVPGLPEERHPVVFARRRGG